MSVVAAKNNLRASRQHKTTISLHHPPPFAPPSTPRNWGPYVPLKSRKRGAGFRGVADGAETDAVAQEDGQGDESREPEQHRQGLGGQDAEFVRDDGEARGRDDEVGQREERPGGGDDQDVHFPRRELVPLAGPPVRDCGGRKVSGGCWFGYGWVEMLRDGFSWEKCEGEKTYRMPLDPI